MTFCNHSPVRFQGIVWTLTSLTKTGFLVAWTCITFPLYRYDLWLWPFLCSFTCVFVLNIYFPFLLFSHASSLFKIQCLQHFYRESRYTLYAYEKSMKRQWSGTDSISFHILPQTQKREENKQQWHHQNNTAHEESQKDSSFPEDGHQTIAKQTEKLSPKQTEAGEQYQLSLYTTKATKWHVRPAKTQISLGIRPVWSESSLCAQ